MIAFGNHINVSKEVRAVPRYTWYLHELFMLEIISILSFLMVSYLFGLTADLGGRFLIQDFRMAPSKGSGKISGGLAASSQSAELRIVSKFSIADNACAGLQMDDG